MPVKKYYYKYKNKIVEKTHHKFNRYTWLAIHPEDIPMDRENQKTRKTGYANDDARNLMAAICLRVCMDYKAARDGVVIDNYTPKETMDECRKFFVGDMFQYFVNGMSVKDVEERLKAIPRGKLRSLWRYIAN